MSAARTPATPAPKIDRVPICTPGGSKAKEEKIFVTVRVRPLSKKEHVAKDQVAWQCIGDQRVDYKGPAQDRCQTSYSFDKVFGPDCQTERVYEEGAKDVALSSLTGINATIFAYGQTSSGKTYTMRGVAENAVNDIYKHIRSTPERQFVIKISAMEIYNEIVRDLLRPDSGPLRLLDDHEKGTIVENLEEETAKDSEHLRQLIGICEAKRQVGETALNDTSSRSHQIIRLTVNSSLRDSSGCLKSYVATLNFVDLAGSERAAQTNAIGVRLKEGGHINRSLLTLTTVIRKLSTGRNMHIPYRDSKLTRILQSSLGGNARTAIICTLSPALTHVEQSRNTLFFATCAKEVTTTAQINVVVSDKQLVKHLQKEVARLEAELRIPESSTSDALLEEKENKIKQMEMEMIELKKQRDIAQLQLDELRKKLSGNPPGCNQFDSPPRQVSKCLRFSGAPPCVERKHVGEMRDTVRLSSTAPLTLVYEIRKLEQLQQQLGDEANHAIEVLQKEVSRHRQGNQDAVETIAKLQAEIKEMRAIRPRNVVAVNIGEAESNQDSGANLKEEITKLHWHGNSIAILEVQLENVQRSLDKLIMSLPNGALEDILKSVKPETKKKKRKLPLALSNNINKTNLICAPCSPLSSRRDLESDIENRAPENGAIFSHDGVPSGSEMSTPAKSEDGGDFSSREVTPVSKRSSSVKMKKMQKLFQNAAEENIRSIKAYVTELKERVAKLQYQKHLLVCQVLELEANEAAMNEMDNVEKENTLVLPNSPGTWHQIFKEQIGQIIQLWGICYVSIIHRTQFILLFKGDRADQIYIEVELRRLTWLQRHFAEMGSASPAPVEDETLISLSSSIKALRNEKEFLSKRINSRLTEEEREQLYVKWQVPLESKQRKLQLVNKLWTDPSDPVHIKESADVVARLVGFCEGGLSKEMFELNFALPACKKPWLVGWQNISNFLGL